MPLKEIFHLFLLYVLILVSLQSFIYSSIIGVFHVGDVIDVVCIQEDVSITKETSTTILIVRQGFLNSYEKITLKIYVFLQGL